MCALVGTLALETVAVTAGAGVPVVLWRALLHAHTILENVAVHALQAVCSERPSTGIATPVTFFASLGGDVKIVLRGAALILAFPKEQDLAWVSAGGAAAL